jgi:hypothetical protein
MMMVDGTAASEADFFEEIGPEALKPPMRSFRKLRSQGVTQAAIPRKFILL